MEPTTSSSTSKTSVVVSSSGEDSSRTSTSSGRSSVIDSLRGCGLSGIRVDKEDLRRRILIPQYLRLAVRRAINSKDVNAGVDSADLLAAEEVEIPPEAPLVVFINSRSGGRHGPELMSRLQELITEEQVNIFSLHFVRICWFLGFLEF